MDFSGYLAPALFMVNMIVMSMNSKFLGAGLTWSIFLMVFYANSEIITFGLVFYIPAVILANFRD